MSTLVERNLVAVARDLAPVLRANSQRSDRDARLPRPRRRSSDLGFVAL